MAKIARFMNDRCKEPEFAFDWGAIADRGRPG
jgi:hypothetical protein